MWAAPFLLLLATAPPTPPQDPVDLGLSTSTGTALAQLDVTLTGPPQALARLTADSFEVRVGDRRIRDLLLDSVCPRAVAGEASEGAAPLQPPAAPPRPTTWLLYFDQPHLTQAGRQRALDLARAMLPSLMDGGHRALVVSNGIELETVQDATPDLAALLGALDRLERDRRHLDTFSAEEDFRLEEIRETLRGSGDPGGGNVERAVSLARRFRMEELWRAQRDLARLGMVLGRLVEVEAPKAVLYFADTLRSNAGEHYLRFFGDRALGTERAGPRSGEDIETMDVGRGMGQLSVDRVLDVAAAMGIRFYTVQAQGLVNSEGRVSDAQHTLTSLALETGGAAFLNGVTPKKMLARIEADLGCLALLSFDPSDLPRDRPLDVRVSVKDPSISVQVRGRLVLQSESARVTSRLLSRFALARDGEGALRASLVPLGFEGGRFSALLQVAAPATAIAGATWDLGASVVSLSRVRESLSGRVRVAGRGVPVILEKEITFPPGPMEIVAVAREVSTDHMLSGRIEHDWPDPDADLATLGPIAVLQTRDAAFSRDGAIRTEGTRALDPDEPVRPDRPAALVGLVCRARQVKGTLRVERRLEGEGSVAFPPVDLAFGGERCAQIRDLLPRGTLGPGSYRYRVTVLEGGVERARGERAFHAAAAP
jgi:hypothetical protein